MLVLTIVLGVAIAASIDIAASCTASEEHTIPGVTCHALYSPLFMYKFHHFLNLSTFLFMYLTEIT